MRRIRVFYKVIIGYLLGSLIFTGLASCKNQVDTEYVDRVVEKEKIVEVEKPVTDKTPPSNVTELSALNRGGAIQLVWTDAADSDTYGYEVSYGEKAFAVILQGRGSCYVSDLVNGTEYTFTVKSVDKTGNKSEGVSVKATPTAGYLSISLSVPSDPADGTPVLSNTSADVNVSFGTLSSITKAVWKAGQKGIGVKPNELLSDTTATALTVSSNSATFTVTDSGFYDVVARDSDGHTAWEQVEVKTIDKTAPGEVTGLAAGFDSTTNSTTPIKICWTGEGVSTGIYDSPIDHVEISYVVNDAGDSVSVGTVATGVKEKWIAVPEGKGAGDFLRVTLKVVDRLGNVSTGKIVQAWCSADIMATVDEVAEKIKTMPTSGRLVVTGTVTGTGSDTLSAIRNSLWYLYENMPFIKVSLDLSALRGCSILWYASFWKVKNLIMVELPNITKIEGGNGQVGVGAFGECTALESITIPDTVTEIGNSTFYDCSELKNVIIGNKVERIGGYAFCRCKKLSEIVLPDSVTVVYGDAFFGCLALEKLVIGVNILKLNTKAFKECRNLNSITFNGTIAQWNAIEKAADWNEGVPATKVVCVDGEVAL